MPIDPARLQEALGERYRIERELGRGGFATVFRVWNPRLERAEALKVLAPGHEADEDFPRRFTQEVRLAAALEHRSIVKVYDFGQAGDLYWYSMQLVDGQTLSAELREKGPMRERDLARIAIPLLDALDYSHARGIVHRDIKPENVILDAGRQPFLMDFGIAKSAGSLVKTQTGFLLGTPAYVAPEQAQGKPLDGRADLYALGVTLYRVASGRYPFEAQDPLQAVILRLTQPPRPLSEARPGVDPDFASIVMRALERRRASSTSRRRPRRSGSRSSCRPPRRSSGRPPARPRPPPRGRLSSVRARPRGRPSRRRSALRPAAPESSRSPRASSSSTSSSAGPASSSSARSPPPASRRRTSRRERD
ncbi:MAG: serine/threonine protein kinase, partial [Thermoanaerobaculia bacterium]|nr:serine/threonine protein kinase [Thermoanaerobaculia bacterium]